MSIAVDTHCLECFLKRNLDIVRPLGTEEQAMAFAKEILKLYLNAPEGVPSPWFGPAVADLLHDMYGVPIDRFRQEKLDSNQFVLERMDTIRQKVVSAADPVFAGLQFSILGNYLDFSALQGKVSFGDLEEMLNKGLEMELDRKVYGDLCRDLERGKTLLYLRTMPVRSALTGSSPRRSRRNTPICPLPSASGAPSPRMMRPGRMRRP